MNEAMILMFVFGSMSLVATALRGVELIIVHFMDKG